MNELTLEESRDVSDAVWKQALFFRQHPDCYAKTERVLSSGRVLVLTIRVVGSLEEARSLNESDDAA